MRAGQLVVATPALSGPTFARSVVLLLQAGDEDGALGLVVNQPTGTAVVEVLPTWSALAAPPGLVFTGGPVQPEAAVCLGRARPGGTPSGAFAPLEGLPSLGTVDLDASPEDLTGTLEELRLFAGYAGWSAGQLEAEVADGAWFVLDALPVDAFSPAPELLWADVLRRQGPPIAFAASYPEDPTLN